MRKEKKLYVMLISAVCCSLMIGTLLPIFAEDLQEDMVEEVSVPEQSSNETPKKEDITYENVAEVTEQEKEVIVDDSQQKQLNEISKGSIDVWDGTSSDTSWYNESQSQFILTTANQLNGLAQLIKSGKKMDGKIFQLGNDIYLNSDENPTANESFMIGDEKYFNGTFDGQNYTIHNVYIKKSSRQYVGFFAYTWGEEPVKSLTITGSITGGENTGMVAIANPNAKISYCTNKANITGTNNVAGIVSYKVANISHCINNGKITGTGQTGGIISNAQNTIIENCNNIGDIKGGGCTGGILGYSADYLTVKDCNNNGNVSGGYDTGGIVGKAEWASSISGCQQQGDVYAFGSSAGGIIGTSYGTIKDCINKGGTVDAYWGKTGGIVGYFDSDGTIENCQNDAMIANGQGGDSDQNIDAGGIVGNAAKLKAIKKCKNYGDVTTKYIQGGGIAGSITYQGESIEISDCENSGKIHGQESGGIIGLINSTAVLQNNTNSGEIVGADNIGGIVGIVDNNSRLTFLTNKNHGYIKGQRWIGGLIGSMDGNNTITDCYNDGKVQAVNEEIDGVKNAAKTTGGLIGYANSDSVIEKCTNKGSVLSLGRYLGGIVGSNSSQIKNCINQGQVNFQGPSVKPASGEVEIYIGGIAGWSNAKIISCTNEGSIHVEGIAIYFGSMYSVGGILGYSNKAELLDCLNKGQINIEQKEDYSIFVGGIVGESNTGIVKRCGNQGKIMINIDHSLGLSPSINSYAGGILGRGQMDIQESYNAADIFSEQILTQMGGLVGVPDTYSGTGTVLKNCYNMGQIKVVSLIKGRDPSWAGGLIGVVLDYNKSNTVIQNCYNAGQVILGTNGKKVSGLWQHNEYLTASYCYNDNLVSGTPYSFIDLNTSNPIPDTDNIKSVATRFMTGEDALINMNFSSDIWEVHSDVMIDQKNKMMNVYYPTLKNAPQVNNKAITLHDFGQDNYQYFQYIMNAQELQNIQNNLKMNYVLKNDIDLATEDLLPDDPNNNFKPIRQIVSNNVLGYEGLFDGNHHMIKNLKMTTVNDINQGLFGKIESQGMVSNLYLSGKVQGNHLTGGLTGNNCGTIQNCYVQVDILSSAKRGDIGGVVGSNDGVIKNSMHVGTVKAADTLYQVNGFIGDLYIGGFAGENHGIIEHCNHVGDVSGNANDITRQLIMGGFAGYQIKANDSYIHNVYTVGNVTDQTTAIGKSRTIGALIGSGNGEILRSYYDMNVAEESLLMSGKETIDSSNKGLTTMQMTGNKAIDNVLFESFDNYWLIRDDHIQKDDNQRFYPIPKIINEGFAVAATYYKISFTNSDEYKVNIPDGYEKDGSVLKNYNFQFIIQLDNDTLKDQLVVKDNDHIIQPINQDKGLYELTSVQKDHVIQINIQKLRPTVTFPTKATMSYGQTLKDATYYGYEGDGIFHFKELDRKLSVKESGKAYTMVFTPNNTNKFESIEQDVIVYVEPIHTTIPNTIYLDYQENITLKDVKLPSGWSWNELNQSVQIGEHKYLASYHDQEGNYKDMADMLIKVIMKDKGEKPELPYNPEIIIPSLPNDSNNEPSNMNGIQNNLSENQNQVATNDKTNIIPLAILLSLSGIIIGIVYKKKRIMISRK